MLQLLIKHGAYIDLRASEETSTLELTVNTLDVEKLNLLLRPRSNLEKIQSGSSMT